MIVGLNGYAQSGKDTVGDILVARYEFQKVGFADKLRECMTALNPTVKWGTTYLSWNEVVNTIGYERAKQETDGRVFMQRLGTEVVRDILGEDIWVDAATWWLLTASDYVFIDTRLPNEAAKIKEYGGEVWRIERPGTGPATDADGNVHSSETALDDFDFDFVIANDGTLMDLRVQVRLLMKDLKTPSSDLLGVMGEA